MKVRINKYAFFWPPTWTGGPNGKLDFCIMIGWFSIMGRGWYKGRPMSMRGLAFKYKLNRWMFKWVSDEDGDIGIQIFGVITFIKYKESTLIYLGKKYQPADKWQGSVYYAGRP